MQAPMPAEIKQGDRLKWKLEENGIIQECIVESIYRIHPEGIEVHTQSIIVRGLRKGAFRRAIHMEWLTRYNGKKIRSTGSSGQSTRVDFGTEASEAEQISFQH